MATKEFHLGDILSVTTGVLVSSMDGIYNVLNHMTQDELYTHQLLIACPIMREELIRQFPFLGDVVNPVGLSTQEGCDGWVANQAFLYGDIHELTSAEHLWAGHTVFGDLNDIWEGKYRD